MDKGGGGRGKKKRTGVWERKGGEKGKKRGSFAPTAYGARVGKRRDCHDTQKELQGPSLRPILKQDVHSQSMSVSFRRHTGQIEDASSPAFPALCRLNCRRSTPCRLRRHARRYGSADRPCSETARGQRLPTVVGNITVL